MERCSRKDKVRCGEGIDDVHVDVILVLDYITCKIKDRMYKGVKVLRMIHGKVRCDIWEQLK